MNHPKTTASITIPFNLLSDIYDDIIYYFNNYKNEDKKKVHTSCVRKVSDLRSYRRVGAILCHPDRGILRSSPHLIEPQAPSGASTS